MRRIGLVLLLAVVWPELGAAQSQPPAHNTFAVGADVGFLAADTEGELQPAAGHVAAFVEYYAAPRSSLRVMYGWAAPEFEARPGRTLQRHHLNVNYIYNWQIKRFRPFATVGGGAYFLSVREGGNTIGRATTKPGGSIGWGGEYYFRTFAVKSEMNVHILDTEDEFPDLNGRTLTAFTWTFGVKVPF